MLANFFDKTKPINSIVLSVLFFLLFTTHFFLRKEAPTDYNHWGLALFSLLLNIAFIFLNSYYFIKNKVSNENLHNTFALILLYGLFPSAFLEIKFLIVSLLYLLIYKNIAQLKSKEKKQSTLFDTGIYAGISFLIFYGAVVFLPFIFFGIILSKKIKLKNILSPILGFATTLILFFSYCFFTNNLAFFFEKTAFNSILNYNFHFQNYLATPLIILAAVTAISILASLTQVLSINSPYRFQYGLAISMLFFGTLAMCSSGFENGAAVILIFTPSSILIGRFIKSFSGNTIKDLFLTGFSICSLYFLIKNS